MHLLLYIYIISKRQQSIGIIYKLEISIRYKGALVIVKNIYTVLGSVCIWLLINIYILIQHFSSTYFACGIHKIPCDLDNKNLQQGLAAGAEFRSWNDLTNRKGRGHTPTTDPCFTLK